MGTPLLARGPPTVKVWQAFSLQSHHENQKAPRRIRSTWDGLDLQAIIGRKGGGEQDK